MFNTKIHNLQIEQSVLAALMTVAESYSHVENLLTEDDFYSTRHKAIFKAVVELDAKNTPYDAVLVNNHLAAHGMNEQAHVYTLEEAQKEWTESWGDSQPISADHVDALATWKVDHQLIPSKTVLHDDVNEYVAYQSGRWDGNDVYWLNKLAFSTFTDFSKASVFTRREIDIFLQHQTDYVVIPFADAEKVKRRTFEASLFNARVMVQGVGLT